MKLLIGIIITLFVSVWMALTLRQDPGYAMFSIGELTVETSFAFLMLVLIVLFVGFYFLVRLAIRLWRTPRQTLAANQRRLQRRAAVVQSGQPATGGWPVGGGGENSAQKRRAQRNARVGLSERGTGHPSSQ